MNIQLPPDLESKLKRLAEETGQAPDELALDLLANSVTHDDWFRREVEKGIASARAGRVINHDQVAERFTKLISG